MRLDIYDKCGPAGAGELNLDHTVNAIWFLELLKRLNATYKNRPFTILEIGSGAGGGLSYYKNEMYGMTAFACDVFVPAMLDGKKKHADLIFFAADGCQLSLTNKCFDAVMIHDVLEHVDKPLELLKEAYRVLKPGGALHLFVPCEGQPGTVHSLFRNNPKEKHGHIQNFRRNDVVDMLNNAGFAIKTRLDSFHLIGQVSDIIPYLVGRNRPEYLLRITDKVVGLFARAAYVESRLLENYPGLCLEIVAVK
jgi:SAM-dependent methyltransferase